MKMTINLTKQGSEEKVHQSLFLGIFCVYCRIKGSECVWSMVISLTQLLSLKSPDLIPIPVEIL